MAGTFALSPPTSPGTKMLVLSGTAISDSSGNADSNTLAVSGLLWGVEVDPVTPGVAPTALWDFTVKTARGVDLMGGAGANQSESAAAFVPPTTADNNKPPLANEAISVHCTNMGDAKQVAFRVYILQV